MHYKSCAKLKDPLKEQVTHFGVKVHIFIKWGLFMGLIKFAVRQCICMYRGLKLTVCVI